MRCEDYSSAQLFSLCFIPSALLSGLLSPHSKIPLLGLSHRFASPRSTIFVYNETTPGFWLLRGGYMVRNAFKEREEFPLFATGGSRQTGGA